MISKEALPLCNRPMYYSAVRIIPDHEKSYHSGIRNGKKQFTDSTLGNDEEHSMESGAFAFTIDAVITLKNLRTKG